MNCFPELTYSVYVDGELPAAQVRQVKSHLVQCQRCRELIVALEDEGAVLADLLRETERAAARGSPGRARARGLVIGLGPALALVALVATVGGWLLEQRLPPGMSWMNPLTLFGAYEMFFDTVFLVRDKAPALFDLAVAVGATVGLASVLTFLVGALFRRVTSPAALGFAALAFTGAASLLAAVPAQALDVRWGLEKMELGASEKLADTLIVSAEIVVIDGELDGDLIALGHRITIGGTVRGNVFAAGREVLVTGVVEGSLHMGCERCTLEGVVEGNSYAGGEFVTVTETGEIGRDAHLFGEGIRMDGRTQRDFFSAGSWIEVRGDVGRKATTRSERLTVFDGARIGGDLEVHVPESGEASIAAGARIEGETERVLLEEHMPEMERNRWATGHFYLRAIVVIVSAFLVGMFLHAVFPTLFSARLVTSGDFVRCLGFGFVALIATPILLIICMITVVGIPIGIIGFFVYLTTLFVSVIVVAVLVGSSITGADPESSHGFGAALLLGLVIVIVAMNLPFIGGLLRLLAGLTGMGLLVVGVRQAWQDRAVA